MITETFQIYSLYCITNLINNKTYIGQSIDVNKRLFDHRKAVRINKPAQIIHHAMIKYGLDNFKFEIIAQCKMQEDSNELEALLIQQYQSHISTDKGYNVTLGGMNAPKTEEWKQKISQILMGHEVSQEARDKMSKAHKGKPLTEEHKKNIAIASSQRTHSEETRKKLSEINMGNQNKLGFKVTNETKEKISKGNKGKKPSEKTLDAAKKITKGKTWKIVDGKRVWVDKMV